MDQSTLTESWQRELMAWFAESCGPDGEIEQFNLCAALAVLERMRHTYPLLPTDYITPKGQVRGLGGPSIARILARHGERRPYLSEGGRTTRGSRPSAEALVHRFNNAVYQAAPDMNRNPTLDILQQWIVRKIQETYLDRQRLKVDLNSRDPFRVVVKHILDAASEVGKMGPVAQHLVGAKLQIRFPTLEVPNYSATTADAQLGRHGDFEIDQTVFHVTVAPADPLFQKCESNRRLGYRVVVLVPNAKREAALQLADVKGLREAIDIFGLEDFLGQNLGEVGQFSEDRIAATWRELLETYNQRVRQVEPDSGLLIEIPAGL